MQVTTHNMHFTAEIWVSLVLIATNMCAKNGYCILSPQLSCSYMTGLHMLPAVTAAPFVRNVHGILAILSPYSSFVTSC